MICPKCGSTEVDIITERTRIDNGFDICNGLLGYICLGPIGILCGACGGKEKIHEEKFCKCKFCGLKFKL